MPSVWTRDLMPVRLRPIRRYYGEAAVFVGGGLLVFFAATLPWDRGSSIVPFLWAASVVAGRAVSVARKRRRTVLRNRAAAGACLRCGYDMRATPLRCPECGYRTTWSAG